MTLIERVFDRRVKTNEFSIFHYPHFRPGFYMKFLSYLSRDDNLPFR